MKNINYVSNAEHWHMSYQLWRHRRIPKTFIRTKFLRHSKCNDPQIREPHSKLSGQITEFENIAQKYLQVVQKAMPPGRVFFTRTKKINKPYLNSQHHLSII